MTPQPRTQADDFNRLIAVAFEEKVTAMAALQQAHQQLAAAGQLIEQLRADVKTKDAKIAELTAPTEAAGDSSGGTPD